MSEIACLPQPSNVAIVLYGSASNEFAYPIAIHILDSASEICLRGNEAYRHRHRLFGYFQHRLLRIDQNRDNHRWKMVRFGGMDWRFVVGHFPTMQERST